MPGIFVATNQASAPTNTLVGASSGQVLALNSTRKGCVLVNISSSTMYISFDGNASVLNAGLSLSPNGGSWSMDDYTFTLGQINAIAHSAGNILAITEFTT